MRTLLLAAAAVAIAAPAASIDRASAEERLAAATEGKTPGTPVACVDRKRTQRTESAGDRLLFRVSSRLTYVNTTTGGCGLAGHTTAFVFRSTSSRLCEGDVAETVDPRSGMTLGTCVLGAFTPYAR